MALPCGICGGKSVRFYKRLAFCSQAHEQQFRESETSGLSSYLTEVEGASPEEVALAEAKQELQAMKEAITELAPTTERGARPRRTRTGVTTTTGLKHSSR